MMQSIIDDAGSIMTDSIVFASGLDHLPPVVNGVITLSDNTSYFITDNIDLQGARIIDGINTTLLGVDSSHCGITSTGLGAGVPLITADTRNLITRNLRFYDVDTLFEVSDASWFGTGCIIEGVQNIGTFTDCPVIAQTFLQIIDSEGMVFTGTSDDIGFINSYASGRNDGTSPIMTLADNFTLTGRLILDESTAVANANDTLIHIGTGLTAAAETIVVQGVNFSGAGIYLTGLNPNDTEVLLLNNRGIPSTHVHGQAYMQGNATATTVASASTWYKVAGTTTEGSTDKVSMTANNQLQIDAGISRTYKIEVILSFNTSPNNVVRFAIYESNPGSVCTPSIVEVSSDASGGAQNITCMCLSSAVTPDKFEVHCSNETAANNITVVDMNFIITEI